jgi:hypothetical protein
MNLLSANIARAPRDVQDKIAVALFQDGLERREFGDLEMSKVNAEAFATLRRTLLSE